MMESPSSTDRRQAWAHSSRRWQTLEDPESGNACPGSADPHLSLQDDVFLDVSTGCSTGKIETWLLGCGSEAGPENLSHPSIESLLKTCNSFEDDLSLGAEATALDVEPGRTEMGHCTLLMPPPKSRRKNFTTSTPQQRLNLPFYSMGHSMASSAMSTATSKTASSVSEVLRMCTEDPEETLYQLGFGCEEPQVTARIPARFFTFPSQLKGINFRLFLESQLTRIRQEDPSLSLASRFRQVEVLTAMANAFYSLYSHVSRTPLQKLAPPEFSFSSPTVERTIGPRFFGSVRSEPRSPVERLKDTVSKMCLYTGSRGSDSVSPSQSPRKRNSLPDVVGIVLDNQREKTEILNMDGKSRTDKVTERQREVEREVEVRKDRSDPDRFSLTDMERIQRLRASLSGQRERLKARTGLFTSSRESLDLKCPQNSLGNMAIPEQSADPFSQASQSDNPHGTTGPIPKITHDVICPQIVECVRQAPYRSPQTDCRAAGALIERDQSNDLTSSISQSDSKENQSHADLSTKAEDREHHLDKDAPQVYLNQAALRITVTGLDGDVTSIHRDALEDTSSSNTNDDKLVRPLPSFCKKGNQRYLSPVKAPALGHAGHDTKQVNSFELEEVQSAGEEDVVSPELKSTATLTVEVTSQHKGLPLRGDSFQSDSSGYAEEDVHLSLPIAEKPSNS